MQWCSVQPSSQHSIKLGVSRGGGGSKHASVLSGKSSSTLPHPPPVASPTVVLMRHPAAPGSVSGPSLCAGSYSTERLRELFGQEFLVQDVILKDSRKKKKASALVVLDSVQAAAQAAHQVTQFGERGA